MDKQFSLSLKTLLTVSLLCIIGFFIAAYLEWLHFQVHTNPSFHSFCAMNDGFNCETVAESPYAVFLDIPNAIWGMFGYLFMFVLTWLGIYKYKSPWAFFFLFCCVVISLIVSVLLAVVSYCVICSFCVMCSATYVINVLLFAFITYKAIKQRFPFKRAIIELPVFVQAKWLLISLTVVVVLLIWLFVPRYWHQQDDFRVHSVLKGVTEDGQHWVGASSPSMTVTEYSDYMCPHCRRAHQLQRAIVNSNFTKMRLIHRQFPLDDACNPLITSPFHPGACLLASAAICAGDQGKFWEMNDMLYSFNALIGETVEERIIDAARRIGISVSKLNDCLDSEEAHKKLEADIKEGLSLELAGTPSFVVDGKVHLGMIEPEVYHAKGIEVPFR